MRCTRCGYRGKPRPEPLWLLLVTVGIWIVPLAFLAFGYWPFLLLPAIAVTVWAVFAIHLQCPACGAPRGAKNSASRTR